MRFSFPARSSPGNFSPFLCARALVVGGSILVMWVSQSISHWSLFWSTAMPVNMGNHSHQYQRAVCWLKNHVLDQNQIRIAQFTPWFRWQVIQNSCLPSKLWYFPAACTSFSNSGNPFAALSFVACCYLPWVIKVQPWMQALWTCSPVTIRVVWPCLQFTAQTLPSKSSISHWSNARSLHGL